MTYKSLSLAALLLPCFGYGVTKEARINQLKESQFKTTFELKSIMKHIRSLSAEHYCINEFDTFLQAVIRIKADKNISKDVQGKRMKDEGEAKQKMLENALFCMPDVDDSKIETLLSSHVIFNAFEALYIESAIDVSCFAALQEKAKKCLRELLVINKELAQLSKLYIQ